MYNYSIMPLNTAYIKEICDDIRNQYEQGVCSLALFCIRLVPEGNPPVNKAKIECEKYDLFRDELAKTGHECGILAQCTIGHGYPLDNMFGFQQYTGLRTGEKLSVACPYDQGFREYIKNAMSTLASHNPKSIMVDDDFRLLTRGERGCACSLHMAEFNRRAGTQLSREELFEIVKDTSKEENRRLKRIFEDTQRDSLIGAAKAMREGIDAVNPKIQGVFCTCGNDPAGEITKILAGDGNPSIMRINNGSYTAPGARNVSGNMYKAAKQIALSYNKVDIYLAETDTCPQNRYSTSAQYLHNHFTASILEGVNGAKHWITRLTDYEPNSGKAYRKILGKNKGFYETLGKLVPELEWVGCKIPLPSHTSFNFAESPYSFIENGWSACVLERLGLPMYFSSKDGGVVFLDGEYDNDFTDEEINNFFRGTVVLSSSAALSLINRGFGSLIGVKIKDWNGRNISGERLNINGKCCAKQMEAKELVINSQNTTADSFVYHIPDGETKEIMFPASIIHKNELGGTTIVFCGTPSTEFKYYTAFSFLNESRKLQLINMLSNENKLPVYYPEDAEVYLKAANMKDGNLFCGFFNIGLDPLDEIPLTTDFDVKGIQILSNDGIWKDVKYKKNGDTYILEKSAGILDPVMIMLKKDNLLNSGENND